MTPEQYQQVGRLFQAALELEADERAGFLTQACGGDEQLRREVESLIGAHEQAGSFMAAPAPEVAAQGLAGSRAGSLVGRQLGAYAVLSLLGTGGMGEVYR